MKIKIETKIPEQGIIPYNSEKCYITTLKGREYKRVGKSYETLSNPARFLKVLKMIGYVGLAILSAFTLFCSEKYRKKIKQISKEIKGCEKIVYVVPFLSDKVRRNAKKFLNDTLNEVEGFLGTRNDGYETQKAKKASPINSEIYVKLLIGNEEQVFSFFLKNENGSALNKDQIHAHMEEIKSEIEAKIEKAQNFYEGMVISAIYKNENNKIDLIVLDDTQPGTKAFAKLEYISSLPRCMQPSTSNGLGIWEYYDSPLFRQA